MHQQHLLELIQLPKRAQIGPLEAALVFKQTQVNKCSGGLVPDEWPHHFLEEWLVVVLDVGVELVADLVVVGFEFLLFRVGVPVGHPVFNCCSLDLGETDDVGQSYCRPDTVSANFDGLSFLSLVDFSGHGPGCLFAFGLDSCVAEVSPFGVFD